MKLNKSSQLVLVSAASLLAAALVTACSQFTQTLTVDFVYVASPLAAGANQYGQIDVYEINSESGQMRQIPSSPFPSGGRNPVSEAVSADYGSLFVANQDDNSIVQFVIGTDGKLYPFNTVNTPGIYPLAIAANKADLFVLDTYQPLPIASSAHPCSGSIAVYPLTAASGTTPVALGSPAVNTAVSASYWPLALPGANSDTTQCTSSSHVIVPTGVTIQGSGAYVYVTAYDSSVTPNVGYVFAFSVGTNGVLTAVPGSPFAAGVHPSAVTSDSSGSYLYVTDYDSASVLGFSIANGVLTPLSSGANGTNEFAAGNSPAAIVADPSYPFVYVANSLDSTVTAYSINNGALTKIADYATGTQPVAIGIDPSTNHFLFTANFLGDTVSGFELSTTNGTLLDSQYSPYSANKNPTAVAAIPHNGTGAGVQ